MLYNLKPGEVAKFSVFPTLFNRISQTDLTYQGSVSASLVASIAKMDAAHEWIKAWPSIKDRGLVNDPNHYEWLIFTTISGDTIAINEQWIDPTTMTVVGKTAIWVVEVRGNAITPEIIRKQLSAVGIEILRTYAKGE